MAILRLSEIIEATGGELLSDGPGTFSGVSIDSRTIADGELFFAIRGEWCNGHDFLRDALLKGGGAVVDTRQETLPKGKAIIHVKETLRSLQDLAHFLRMRRDIPVVAVTGSNGKTTTKEMIHQILSRKFRTLKNKGNLNNLIGLPLSLLQIDPADEVIVLEMGMNAPGEIRRLSEIAVPGIGVVTNIGLAHIGRLGSHDAVRDAKLEIIDGLGIAILNADDNYLMQGFRQIKDFNGELMTFALKSEADVMARDIRVAEKGIEFVLDIREMGSTPVNLNVHGIFNVYNALAASAVSSSLGMGIDEIRAALEAFKAFPMRFEIIKKNGITVINDSYNANPSSIRESVMELTRLKPAGRIVAILGDMRELSEFSEDEHISIGKMISKTGVNVFIAVGEKMSLAAREIMQSKGAGAGQEIFVFRDVEETKKNIRSILEKGDTVLIKGSRSMSMEVLMEEMDNAL